MDLDLRPRSLLHLLRGAVVTYIAMRYGLLCVRDLKPNGRPTSHMPTVCFYQVNSCTCYSKAMLFTCVGSATHVPLSSSCTFTYHLTFYLLYFNRFWQPYMSSFTPWKCIQQNYLRPALILHSCHSCLYMSFGKHVTVISFMLKCFFHGCLAQQLHL